MIDVIDFASRKGSLVSRSSSLASYAASELGLTHQADEPYTRSGRPSVRMVRVECDSLNESALERELLALLEAHSTSTGNPHATMLVVVVGPKSLPRLVPSPMTDDERGVHEQTSDVRCEIRAFERERIVAALRRTAGNQTEAAKILGFSRRTLTNKLNAHGLPRPRKRAKERVSG